MRYEIRWSGIVLCALSNYFVCDPCPLGSVGLLAPARIVLATRAILIASYFTFTLGAFIPPSTVGRIALSQAIWPFRPFQMNFRVFLSIVAIYLFRIPFNATSYRGRGGIRVFASDTLPVVGITYLVRGAG